MKKLAVVLLIGSIFTAQFAQACAFKDSSSRSVNPKATLLASVYKPTAATSVANDGNGADGGSNQSVKLSRPASSNN